MRVNEKAPLTADMALRLDRAFGVSMELLTAHAAGLLDVAEGRARERTISRSSA